MIQWIRDGLQFIQTASDSEAMAEAAAEAHGVVFVPAFTGLGAPYWDPHARGGILGLTRDTGPKEICAAAIESVCFQTLDLLKAMAADGADISKLKVDGGMIHNQWMLQRLSDLSQLPVIKPKVAESTALGVAYLVGLQHGVFEDFKTIASLWQKDKDFTSQHDKAWSDERYAQWGRGIKAVQQAHGS